MANEHIIFDFKGAAEQMLKEAFKEYADEWTAQLKEKVLSEIETEIKSSTPRWISKGSKLWECSECGKVIYSESLSDRREFHAFCGRCGAYMWNHNDISEVGGQYGRNGCQYAKGQNQV